MCIHATVQTCISNISIRICMPLEHDRHPHSITSHIHNLICYCELGNTIFIILSLRLVCVILYCGHALREQAQYDSISGTYSPDTQRTPYNLLTTLGIHVCVFAIGSVCMCVMIHSIVCAQEQIWCMLV